MTPETSITTRVLEALVGAGVVTAEQVASAAETAEADGRTVDAVLHERGLVSAQDVGGVLEDALGVPSVDLSSYAPDAEALELVPASVARERRVLPLFEIEGMVTVAVGAPFDVFRLDGLAAELGRDVEPVLAEPAALTAALESYYAEGAAGVSGASSDAGRSAAALLREDPLAEAPAIGDVDMPPEELRARAGRDEAAAGHDVPEVVAGLAAGPGVESGFPETSEEAEPEEEPVFGEGPPAAPIAELGFAEETDIEASPAEALAQALERDVETGAPAIDLDVLGVADARAVSLLVADILEDAAERRASHVHLLPYREEFFLVYRVEGRLEKVASAPRSLERGLVDGFLGFARIGAVTGGAPVSGRVRHYAAGREMAVTVSVVSTLAGQRLVAALEPVRETPPSLESLGMGDIEARALTGAAERGRGVILVAAPAGSGSEVTYFSLLAAASAAGRTVYSVERAPSWELPSVAQAVVDAYPGATAPALLQAGLAQDTDVVALQSVAGADESRIALEAAASGKLVILTVQAADAVSGIGRLLDLGADPASLASLLSASLGQRVLRANCPSCSVATTSPLARVVPGLAEDAETMTGTGCSACGGTGKRGTVALFELLPVTDPVRRVIAGGEGVEGLADVAEGAGLRPLVLSGAARIQEGVLTPEELDRVLGLTLA